MSNLLSLRPTFPIPTKTRTKTSSISHLLLFVNDLQPTYARNPSAYFNSREHYRYHWWMPWSLRTCKLWSRIGRWCRPLCKSWNAWHPLDEPYFRLYLHLRNRLRTLTMIQDNKSKNWTRRRSSYGLHMSKSSLQTAETGLSGAAIYAGIWLPYKCLTYWVPRTKSRQKVSPNAWSTIFRIPYSAHLYWKLLNKTIITCYRKRFLPGTNTKPYRSTST
jgi:hypothetical protein